MLIDPPLNMSSEVKDPKPEQQAKIQAVVELAYKTFETDAFGGPDIRNRVFNLDVHGHVFMGIAFTSIRGASRAFKTLYKSSTRNLEITSQHLTNFIDSGNKTNVKHVVRVNGTNMVKKLADGTLGGDNGLVADITRKVLDAPMGGVAWHFEIPYNKHGDCHQFTLAAIRGESKTTFKDELHAAIAKSHGSVMADAFCAYFAKRKIPKDFKPTPQESAQMLSNMQRRECRRCKSTDAPMICSKCKTARYCSKNCQVADWRLKHKKFCAVEHVFAMELLRDASKSNV
jgi:hypothetical protein